MKKHLAKIESKGLSFYYIVSYDPSSSLPIELALMDQCKKSELVQKKHMDAEFVEIPEDVYNEFIQRNGHGHPGYKADELAHLFAITAK